MASAGAPRLNFALNRNKVTRAVRRSALHRPASGTINRVEVGQPIGVFYALNFQGVDPATGDAIYKDIDGDGGHHLGRPDDRGQPHPNFTGGLTNTIAWRGFDLTAFFTFSQGNDVFNAMRLFSDAGGYYTDNQFGEALARWQKPGDKTTSPGRATTAPRGRATSPAGTSRTAPTSGSRSSRSATGCPSILPAAGDSSRGRRLPLGSQPVHDHQLYRLLTRREQQRYRDERRAGYRLLRLSHRAHLHLRHSGGVVMAPHHSRRDLQPMRTRFACAFALLPWLAGCNSILDTSPTDQLPRGSGDHQRQGRPRGSRRAPTVPSGLRRKHSLLRWRLHLLQRPLVRQRHEHRHLHLVRRCRCEPAPSRQRRRSQRHLGGRLLRDQPGQQHPPEGAGAQRLSTTPRRTRSWARPTSSVP